MRFLVFERDFSGRGRDDGDERFQVGAKTGRGFAGELSGQVINTEDDDTFTVEILNVHGLVLLEVVSVEGILNGSGLDEELDGTTDVASDIRENEERELVFS